MPALNRIQSTVVQSVTAEKTQEVKNEKLDSLRRELDYKKWKDMIKNSKDDVESNLT